MELFKTVGSKIQVREDKWKVQMLVRECGKEIFFIM